MYIGIGSPTVWHNPTQIVAVLSSLLCVFYTAHIVYLLQNSGKGQALSLPWKKLMLLGGILLFSAVCKPTFLQAFLPRRAEFSSWRCGSRIPSRPRIFLQVIAAFLPAVLYFVMQYLYYTGVVVPFTSGVALTLSLERFWAAIRNMLMMAAFPAVCPAVYAAEGTHCAIQ